MSKGKPISRNWAIGARIGGAIRARQTARDILSDDSMSAETYNCACAMFEQADRLEALLRKEF